MKTRLRQRRKRTIRRRPLVSYSVAALALCALLYAGSFSASAQRTGEYLTEKEIELVREFQEIDARTSVFLYIADRRLKVMSGVKETAKELETWGPPPLGTKSEMLEAYRRAMNELMDKLEDAYERNPKAAALKKAIDLLHATTERQLKQLASLRSTLSGTEELSALDAATDSAQIAHEAEVKGPAPAPKEKKKRE